MKNVFVLFPINLYRNISYLKDSKIYLVELDLYFNRYSKELGKMKFNALKPIYHRASMKYYEKYLIKKGIECEYINLDKDWINYIKKNNKKDTIYKFFDPVDKYLNNIINTNFNNYEIIDSPSFILTTEDLKNYNKNNKSKRQTSFYSNNRKLKDILMDNGNPVGGKLTYDTENRKPPKNDTIKKIPKDKIYNNKFIKEGIKYVKDNIPNKNLIWNDEIIFKFPIDHKNSRKVLKNFIRNKINNFGTYQDIIINDIHKSFLYHSGISVMLNVGLITPEYVISQIIKYYNKLERKERKNNINNIEGFIRQILGWREFCRYIYEMEYDHVNKKNYFSSKKKLNKKWYNGTLNILPVDNCIKKAFKYGYLHHIERLMIMSNYMMLSNIDPKEMYKWFMEFSLDSYDWVMFYNIYSMGSYSDGGFTTTKPYISSSNYVLKMSNYKKQKWSKKWDYMFWDFMKTNKNKIKKIPRLYMLLRHLEKK